MRILYLDGRGRKRIGRYTKNERKVIFFALLKRHLQDYTKAPVVTKA